MLTPILDQDEYVSICLACTLRTARWLLWLRWRFLVGRLGGLLDGAALS